MGLLIKWAAMLGLDRPAAAIAAQAPAENPHLDQARAAFPFEIVTVPGTRALTEWERLRKLDKGWPVIVGDDDALSMMLEQFDFDHPPVDEILAAADKIDVPAELQRLFDQEYGEDPFELPEGEWPEPGQVAPMSLTVHADVLTGKPFARTHIVIVPTTDSAEVAAYLRWGGWNACPPPEVHVAMHRKWIRDYGAEIVGLSGDTINMRAKCSPTIRDEAMDLAREQFLYCSDIVLQGTDTLEPLAAGLMADNWWYFWWD